MLKKISDLDQREIIPGYNARFVHTENMTLAFLEVEAGAEMPVHSHFHEQTTQVTEGKFELHLNDQVITCEPGSVVVIPSTVPHGGKAVTKCRLFDVFYPVREDFKTKS